MVPAFRAALQVHLVETSPDLRAAQQQRLGPAVAAGTTTSTSCPTAPRIILANEFFDALPIRQFIRRDGAWRERHRGAMARFLEPARRGAAARCRAEAPEGAIAEHRRGRAGRRRRPRRARCRDQGGALLALDYGPAEAALGDSLQAMRGHGRADPLAEPGTVDVTAHVRLRRPGRGRPGRRRRGAWPAADGRCSCSASACAAAPPSSPAPPCRPTAGQASSPLGRRAADRAGRDGPPVQGALPVRSRPRHPSGFRDSMTDAEYLTTPALGALTGLRHGFFTRRGGVSEGPWAALNCSLSGQDDRERVRENRRRAAGALGLPPAALHGLTQVHGIAVAEVDASRLARGPGPPGRCAGHRRPGRRARASSPPIAPRCCSPTPRPA